MSDTFSSPAAAVAQGPASTSWLARAGALRLPSGLAQLFRQCKPRVISLIVFTAVIGMFLAVPGLPDARVALFGSIGIGLVAAAAAALNCLIEREIDAKMARTQARPLPAGRVTVRQTLLFALVLGGVGLLALYVEVNALTMWLTLATFFGYAIVYTVVLKPLTPQNIVIGGIAGAMPPVLGWCAVTGEVPADALLLLLIIFVWTPPHFWALALYRTQDYAKAGIPMLPVTHGQHFTCLQMLLYTILLAAASLMPVASGMSGILYLACAILLDAAFLRFVIGLYRRFDARLAARTFRYSIFYLSCLFAALLLDHYVRF